MIGCSTTSLSSIAKESSILVVYFYRLCVKVHGIEPFMGCDCLVTLLLESNRILSRRHDRMAKLGSARELSSDGTDVETTNDRKWSEK